MKKLSFFNKIIYGINIPMALVLILACIVSYTSSASLSFLSLGVPLLIIFNLLFLGYWLLKGKWIFWVSLMALGVNYFTMDSFVEFRKSLDIADASGLKVMSFNSLGFNWLENLNQGKTAEPIIAFVGKENPDILCFQEFDIRRKDTGDFDQFPYQFVSSRNSDRNDKVLLAVFSKYPIINKGVLEFPRSANNAIFCDVVVNKDTVRIYNIHLESLNIRPSMLQSEKSEKLFKRLSYSFSKQHKQAAIFKENAKSCNYKKIVCGDFNNTQFSAVYRTIKGDMLDSFTEKGSGYGKTIKFWHFPLRIDFILADAEFEITAHQNYNLRLSDHEPIMSSIQFPINK